MAMTVSAPAASPVRTTSVTIARASVTSVSPAVAGTSATKVSDRCTIRYESYPELPKLRCCVCVCVEGGGSLFGWTDDSASRLDYKPLYS